MADVLKALREEYEEVSHMKHWKWDDGRDARIICATIENILVKLGYKLDEVEWVVK